MNPFALFAVLFGVITIILFFALLTIVQSHRAWRKLALAMRDQGNEVMTCTTALEQRNQWLEVQYQHRNVGMVVLIRQPKRDWVMRVPEMSGAP